MALPTAELELAADHVDHEHAVHGVRRAAEQGRRDVEADGQHEDEQAPAKTPGRLSGQNTLTKAREGRAPRLSAAGTRSGSMRSITA